jgi:hypothetical protein
MPVNLPHAKKLATDSFEGESKSFESQKRLIEQWINEKLLPAIKNHKPNIDLRKRMVNGYATVECPTEYYGSSGISKEMWMGIYESIIKPLGYEPIYTHDGGGLYAMVGVKWCVSLS